MPAILTLTCREDTVTAILANRDTGAVLADARCRVEGDDFDQAAEEAVAQLIGSLTDPLESVLLSAPPADHAFPHPAVGIIITGAPPGAIGKVSVPSFALKSIAPTPKGAAGAMDEDAAHRDIPAFVLNHRLQGLAVCGAGDDANPHDEDCAAGIARQTTGLPVLEAHLLPVADEITNNAMRAAETMWRIVLLRRLAAGARGFLVQATGASPPMRLVEPDDSLLAALASEHLKGFLHWFSI